MSWFTYYYKVTWYTCIHGNDERNSLSATFPGIPVIPFPRKLKNRNAKKDSGGILILISNKMHDSIQVQRESDTLVWITIQGKCLSLPYNVNIGIIYMPPEGSPYACRDDFENLGEMIRKKSKTGPVLICGDANSHTSEIPDFCLLSDLWRYAWINAGSTKCYTPCKCWQNSKQLQKEITRPM